MLQWAEWRTQYKLDERQCLLKVGPRIVRNCQSILITFICYLTLWRSQWDRQNTGEITKWMKKKKLHNCVPQCKYFGFTMGCDYGFDLCSTLKAADLRMSDVTVTQLPIMLKTRQSYVSSAVKLMQKYKLFVQLNVVLNSTRRYRWALQSDGWRRNSRLVAPLVSPGFF